MWQQLCLRRHSRMFQHGEDSDSPVEVWDFSFLLKGKCWTNHCLVRWDLLITTGPWTASEVSAKSDRENWVCWWSVKTCYTTPVPSLGNVYGSASWKRLTAGALCMALLGAWWLFCCSTTKKTISGMYLIQPAKAAMSKDSPACGIQEPEEKCVRVSRESAVSPSGKKNVMEQLGGFRGLLLLLCT